MISCIAAAYSLCKLVQTHVPHQKQRGLSKARLPVEFKSVKIDGADNLGQMCARDKLANSTTVYQARW